MHRLWRHGSAQIFRWLPLDLVSVNRAGRLGAGGHCGQTAFQVQAAVGDGLAVRDCI